MHFAHNDIMMVSYWGNYCTSSDTKFAKKTGKLYPIFHDKVFISILLESGFLAYCYHSVKHKRDECTAYEALISLLFEDCCLHATATLSSTMEIKHFWHFSCSFWPFEKLVLVFQWRKLLFQSILNEFMMKTWSKVTKKQ